MQNKKKKSQKSWELIVLYVAYLIVPHSLPFLSPLTFRMILTRQAFESPCKR